MTPHKLAHAYFLSDAMVPCSRTLCIYIRAFSIATTRGMRHDLKVREPIRACDGGFRDVRAICWLEVTSDVQSA